jgi:hypothetical protein
MQRDLVDGLREQALLAAFASRVASRRNCAEGERTIASADANAAAANRVNLRAAPAYDASWHVNRNPQRLTTRTRGVGSPNFWLVS